MDYEMPMPRIYFIDTGNVCNLSCVFCPTGQKATGVSRGIMSIEAFDAIFNKIKSYAELICLYNWGEPFLNKNILSMVSVCAQHDIHTHIDSNLTMRDFSDEESEAIVKSGLSSLFASIDGVTQETYEKYRVHGNLNRALNNLRQLVKAKERLHMSTPQIGWAFYIHRFNEHEVDQAREVAKDIGINIWFKLLSADPSWYSSFHYQWNEILAFPKWAKRAFPIPIDPRLAERTFHKDVTEVCKQLFFTMIVGWNGDVVPCCSVSGDEYKIGNLLEDSLEVVWNNIEFRACRKFISNFGRIKNTTNSVCENLPCNLSKKQKYDAQYIGSLLKEKEATLSNIYKSRGWKALLTYYKLRDKVLRFKSKL